MAGPYSWKTCGVRPMESHAELCDASLVLAAPAFRIGADENGLGPRLGPLIVTAVLAEVTEKGHKLVGRAPRGRLAELLGDSKALLSHGDVALGEAWARRLIARERRALGNMSEPTTVSELVHEIAIDGVEDLVRPCPNHVKPQC